MGPILTPARHQPRHCGLSGNRTARPGRTVRVSGDESRPRRSVPAALSPHRQPGASGCRSSTLGFDAALGGGWSEYLVAHQTQLHRVGALPSDRAVLAEPASIALHAALHWERRGDRAVVVGPGTIGLLLIAALRRLHPGLDITAVGPGAFSRDRPYGPAPTGPWSPGRRSSNRWPRCRAAG